MVSIEAALMGAPGRALSESERVESGVAKLLDRWFRMGVKRSSSSSRGSARAASYVECQRIPSISIPTLESRTPKP